jgi:hypothetical protein
MYHLQKRSCFNCYQRNHYTGRCPYEKRRVKYDLCVNCQQQGHLLKDCPKEIIIRPLNLTKTAPKLWDNLYLNYAIPIPEDDPPVKKQPSKA